MFARHFFIVRRSTTVAECSFLVRQSNLTRAGFYDCTAMNLLSGLCGASDFGIKHEPVNTLVESGRRALGWPTQNIEESMLARRS